MLGYEIKTSTFDGMAGEQDLAEVYKDGELVKEFTFPCARLQAIVWVVLSFFRGGKA